MAAAETRSVALDEYLGRVRSQLPLGGGRDIVRELESSIRDRVDALAESERRPPDDDLVRRALAEIGEPESVAGAYGLSRSVSNEQLKSFLVCTSIVFAIHLALVGVATTIGEALGIGPVEISPVGPHGLLGMVAAGAHALFLDIGLMVCAFAAAGALRRRLGGSAGALRVDVTPRSTAGRLFLAVLVALVLNVFRDQVFVVVSGSVTYPLFTEWFVSVLPLVTWVLVFSVLSDGLYLLQRETRLTIGFDALHGAAALACMLYLLRGDPILALPPIEQFAAFHEPVNSFLGELGTLVVGALALLFAVKTVRRSMRLAQI